MNNVIHSLRDFRLNDHDASRTYALIWDDILDVVRESLGKLKEVMLKPFNDKKHVPVTNGELYTVIKKIMTIVENATAETHLVTAENMLNNVVDKWGLYSDGRMNVICQSIRYEIWGKRNIYEIEDMANVDRVGKVSRSENGNEDGH